MIIRLCYRINLDKKIEYRCIKANAIADPLPTQTYQEFVNVYKHQLAAELKCSLDNIKPITLNQFLNAIDFVEIPSSYRTTK